MKTKRFVLLSFLAIMLFLAGCGKVATAEQLINSIGKVSIQSLPQIIEAEAAYNELTDKQQSKVSNATVLIDARAEYNRLEHLIQTAQNAVHSIGIVTADSGKLIQVAISAVEMLEAEGLTDQASELTTIITQAQADYEIACITKQYEDAINVYTSGDYSTAILDLQNFIKSYPDSRFTEDATNTLDLCYLELGKANIENGEYELALTWLNEVSESYRTEAQVLYLKIQSILENIRPANNKIIENKIGNGYCSITIDATQSDTDSLVKIESVSDPEKVLLFYVRHGLTSSVNIADGTYTIKYTSGPFWFDSESMFGSFGSFSKADELLEFETTYSGSRIYYNEITITLYKTFGGNLEVTEIDPDSF